MYGNVFALNYNDMKLNHKPVRHFLHADKKQ